MSLGESPVLGSSDDRAKVPSLILHLTQRSTVQGSTSPGQYSTGPYTNRLNCQCVWQVRKRDAASRSIHGPNGDGTVRYGMVGWMTGVGLVGAATRRRDLSIRPLNVVATVVAEVFSIHMLVRTHQGPIIQARALGFLGQFGVTACTCRGGRRVSGKATGMGINLGMTQTRHRTHMCMPRPAAAQLPKVRCTAWSPDP